MANNPALFNAVICGITGGNQQRWAQQTGEVNYSIFQAVGITVATAVDEGIPPDTISSSQAALMQAICQGIFSNRDAINIRHELPEIAERIKELYLQFGSVLQGVISGEGGGTDLTAIQDQITSLQSQIDGVQAGSVPDPLTVSDIRANRIGRDDTNDAEILLSTSTLQFNIQGIAAIQAQFNNGGIQLGFFGGSPVSPPTLFGDNVLTQIESTISSLRNLGLVEDTHSSITRPIITGSTTEDLIGSIINALVSIGLADDGR